MKKIYSSLLLLLALVLTGGITMAQTTLNTTVGSTGYTGTNGAGANFAITFVIENNSGGPILLTDVMNWYNSGNAGAVSLYYSTTSLTGAPTYPLSSPTWTLIGSGTENATVTGLTPISWSPSLNFTIPTGTQYRFAVLSAAYCYYSGSGVGTCTPNVFTSGNVSLEVGDYTIGGSGNYVGYGGGNGPRFFTGSVTFAPAGPCTSPPIAGTTTTSSANPCSGASINLGLSGFTGGTGQTYQWQSGTTATGPWTNIGSPSASSSLTLNATATLYYRAVVTCGTQSANSTPVLVTVPALFPAGTYTINSGAAASGTNFQTFGAAVSAISCGTSGPVIFNVAATSGPYSEQISIPNIATNSATNTITFNCNNTTLTYAGTAAAPHTLMLSGADYMRFNALNVVGTDATYGLVCHLWNGSNNNNFTNCVFSGFDNTTSSFVVPFSISGSATSGTSAGLAGDSNLVTGCTMNSGYYNTAIYGNSGTLATSNQIVNCNLRDFYFYGSYNVYSTGTILRGNNIERPNRTTLSTYYGIYLSTGCINMTVDKNKLHDPFGTSTANAGAMYGIYMVSAPTVGNDDYITNNLIYNLNSNGSQYPIYLSSYSYVHANHNTIVSDYAASTGGLVYGIYSTGTAPIEIKNNIVYITRGGTGVKYGLYYSGTKTSNNNDIYVNSTTGTPAIGYFTTAQTTLAAFQTASGTDANSVSIDPVFNNPAIGDFKPTNPALNNLGTPAGVTTDILNVTRNATTPDIGAYEFTPCAPPTAVAAGSITATTASLSWTPASGVTAHEYVLNQTAADPAGAGTAIASSPYAASGLTPLTTYYFHVRSSCGGSAFSSWVTISFITLCAPPVATIQPPVVTTFCKPDSLTLSAVTGAGLSYQWKLNGTNITGATGTTYRAGGTGSYTLVTTISTCSTTSAPVALTFLTRPDTTVTVTGPTTFCSGSSASLSAPSATGASYQWLLNNGIITGATAATYSATASGSYRVRVSNGTCADTSGTRTITVIPSVVATVTAGGPTTFCSTDSLMLSGPAPVAGVTYQWLFNGGAVAGATNSVFYAKASGSYRLALSNGTCVDTSATIAVTVNPVPTVTVVATNAVICAGSSTALTASGADTYTWSPGAGLSSTTGAAVTATPAATTNYTVTGTTIAGCSASANLTVTVNPLPSVTISPAIATICSGSSIPLTAGGAVTYSWSPATGLSATTGAIVIASPTGTTVYTVTGTDANGCSANASKTVTVNARPTVTVGPGTITNLCPGSTVILTAGGAITYSWSPGTGLSSTTGTSVAASPTVTTIYTVTGTNAAGCTNTATKTVNVYVPTIAISPAAPTSFCGSGSIILTASGATSYTWTPAAGLNTTTGATVTASPTVTTTYSVTGTDANGCTNSATKLITVNAIPVVAITPATATICSGASVALTASGASTYSWTPATGLSATTGATVLASPTSTITYTVTGTSIAGCTASASRLVTVNALPIISITPAGATTFCAGGSVVLNAAGGVSYTWLPTAGLTPATGATVTASPTATVTYTVTGTGANGCTKTATQLITVNPLPVLNVTPATAQICNGSSITLTASGATTYSWAPSATLSASTGATVTASPTITTTYTITGINAAGCTNTTTKQVSVIATPTVVVTPATSTVCSGVGVLLTASGADTYVWAPAASLNAPTGTSVIATPTGTTTYIVTGTSANGCVSTGTATVNVNQLPVIVVAPQGITKSCPGIAITLTASGAVSYAWSPADGLSNTTGDVVTASPASSTVYTVTGTDANGCTSLTNTGIARYLKPVASITPTGNVSMCAFDTALLRANKTIYPSYVWQLNGLNIPGANNAFFKPSYNGAYTVKVTDTNGCTAVSDTAAQVTIKPAPTPVITASGTALSTTAAYSNYQWLRNGQPITGANSRNYTAIQDGMYTVLVIDTTVSGSCPGLSLAFNMTQLGVGNVNLSDAIKVYPNPAASIVHIESPVPVTVMVSGMDGRLILKKENAKDMDISQWADGVYNVVITDKGGKFIKNERIVKMTK